MPVRGQRQGRARTQARTTCNQIPAVTSLFQMQRALIDLRQMEQQQASEGLRQREKGGGMSVLQSFVRSDMRGQTRIPGDMEEVVRDSEEGQAIERQHSGIFGIVVRE